MSAPSDPAAAAGQAPAPAAASAAASSSSGLTFKLHPLVIVNVSDHHTRVKAQAACSGDGSSSSGAAAAAGQPPRVFGCVIGVQRGRTVEIFNSFELVLDPVSGTLDRAFLEKKQELCKLVLESWGFLGFDDPRNSRE